MVPGEHTFRYPRFLVSSDDLFLITDDLFLIIISYFMYRWRTYL